jgi:hypothetical protein
MPQKERQQGSDRNGDGDKLASVALWNLGDVSFITVDKRSGKEEVSDKKLTSDDDISSLLEGYFRSITKPTDSSE